MCNRYLASKKVLFGEIWLVCKHSASSSLLSVFFTDSTYLLSINWSGSPSVHFESESPVLVNRPWLLHMAIKTTHTILCPFKATARTINANASTIPDIERQRKWWPQWNLTHDFHITGFALRKGFQSAVMSVCWFMTSEDGGRGHSPSGGDGWLLIICRFHAILCFVLLFA